MSLLSGSLPKKPARIGRRRWPGSKTFYSAAQTEMTLEGEAAFQFDLDLPLTEPLPTPEPVIEAEQEQGDLFGYLAETPEDTPQIEFDGMEKSIFAIEFADGRHAKYQHAQSLLESLEAQDIHIEYQCREGYCGSCRIKLVEGEVHYTEEPMAWIDDDEILPCCCIPKSPLKLQ